MPFYTLTRDVKKIVKKRIENSFRDYLPKRFKRMIYISSLLSLILQIKKPNESQLEKINSIFKIAKYKDSMAVPIYFNSYIWHDINNTTIVTIDSNNGIPLTSIKNAYLTEKDKDIITDFFINRTPNWLKYGSRNLLKHDTDMIMVNVNKLCPLY